jgi:hypothetical protein
VVVGDPMQLEPVVTLPWQRALLRLFGVAEEWAPSRSSVQRVADRPRGDPGGHVAAAVRKMGARQW